MTPPAVSAPPPPAAAPAAAPAPVPQLRPRAPFSRHRPDRPGLLTGRTIGVSLVLHLLLLAAVLLVPAPEPRVAVVSNDGGLAPRESVEYLEVGAWGEMATDPSASLPEPAPVTAPTAISAAAVDSILRTLPSGVTFPTAVPTGIPQPPGGAPVPGQPGGIPAAQGTGPAGRRRSGPGGLGPELGDPRLVVTPTAIPDYIPTDEERYQAHFEARIRAINDSISGEADAQRRANDWTITDRNGRKWGINERGPVVGGRNVPIPVPIPVPRSSRETEDAQRRERDQRRDIDRQAEQTERERYIRERGRAIRERNDREREEKGGTTTPPAEDP